MEQCLKKFDVEAFIKNRQEESAKMYIEDGFIVLDYAYPYEIKLTRCNTPGKILGWMNQLAEKTWMDADRLSRFAQLAFKRIGIETDYEI